MMKEKLKKYEVWVEFQETIEAETQEQAEQIFADDHLPTASLEINSCEIIK